MNQNVLVRCGIFKTEILFSLVLFITNTSLLFENISLSPLDEESCKLKPTLVKERKLAKK